MNGWPEAIAFVLEQETGGDPLGGLTSDPDDPGGVTRWGISQRAHPGVNVSHLTREQAQRLYHREYWEPLRGPDLPPPVAIALMDWAVHSGLTLPARKLQRLVSAVEDGAIGPKTIAAVSTRAPVDLAVELNLARARHQGALMRGNPALVKYAGGWAARLVALTALVCRLPS